MSLKSKARINYIGSVSIDVYPFGVMAQNVPAYDADWVVNSLLALEDTLLIVGLLMVVSSVLAFVGSLKLPPLLAAPVILNLTAAFIFYSIIRSAIGIRADISQNASSVILIEASTED